MGRMSIPPTIEFTGSGGKINYFLDDQFLEVFFFSKGDARDSIEELLHFKRISSEEAQGLIKELNMSNVPETPEVIPVSKKLLKLFTREATFQERTGNGRN